MSEVAYIALDLMEARALAAKEYAFEQAEASETYGCPLCEGNGYIEGVLYDSKTEAASVGAYGVGRGLERAQEWVEQGPQDVLTLVAEVRRLQALLSVHFEAPRAALAEQIQAACTQAAEQATPKDSSSIFVESGSQNNERGSLG